MVYLSILLARLDNNKTRENEYTAVVVTNTVSGKFYRRICAPSRLLLFILITNVRICLMFYEHFYFEH